MKRERRKSLTRREWEQITSRGPVVRKIRPPEKPKARSPKREEADGSA